MADATVRLTDGTKAVVDADVLPLIERYTWWAARFPGGHQYAHTTINGTTARMHRMILGVIDPQTLVDHIDGNGLNNRRANLRVATAAENSWNRRPMAGDYTSEFKGVSWRRERQRWVAQIRVAGRKRHLGSFRREIEAALAYDAAARRFFGEFAWTNFPDPGPSDLEATTDA